MRVKVGDSWFEATPDQPIMVELTAVDQAHIARCSGAYALAAFHAEDRRDDVERKRWIADGAMRHPPCERRFRDPRRR